MPNDARTFAFVVALILSATGCGDDSVDPSTPPEAGASKDATAAADGGDAGHDGGSAESSVDSGGQTADSGDASPED